MEVKVSTSTKRGGPTTAMLRAKLRGKRKTPSAYQTTAAIEKLHRATERKSKKPGAIHREGWWRD